MVATDARAFIRKRASSLAAGITAREGVSFATIALAGTKGIIAEAASGIDPRIGVPASTTTLLPIGSCQKTLLAASVLRLVEEGRLSLDEPVLARIPGGDRALPAWRTMTARHLLAHSSGLRGMDSAYGALGLWPPDLGADLLERLSWLEPRTAPGAAHVYSNDGYRLLERLVEEITGERWPCAVAAATMDPLEVRRVEFDHQAWTLPRDPGSAGPAPRWRQVAVRCCAREMARIGVALGGPRGRLLSDGLLAEMQRDQTSGATLPELGGDHRYGLGWDSVALPALAASGVRALAKRGDFGPYGSCLVVLPDHGLAAFAGGEGFDSEDAEGLAVGTLRVALDQRGIGRRLPPAVRWPRRPAPVTEVQRAAITGAWMAVGTDPGTLLVIEPLGRRLGRWVLTSEGWMLGGRLRHRGDGWWMEDGSVTRMSAEVIPGALVIERLRDGGNWSETIVAARRLPPTAGPVHPSWAPRLGRRWRVANLPAAVDAEPPELCLRALDDPAVGQGWAVLAGFATEARLVDLSADGDRARFGEPVGLDEVTVVQRDGEEWLRLGSWWLGPCD